MNPALFSSLAAAALAGTMMLAATAATAQQIVEKKKPAPAVYKPVLMIPSAQALAAADAGKERARQKQVRFDKLCTFGPVMSDAAIEGCKQAHRL